MVLLGLGAICVLVAAVVFVAVTWTDLSLGWRATILLAVTLLASAAAGWVLRKGLRGAAETLSLVATGLLLIDLLAGNDAGLPLVSLVEGTAFGWLVSLTMLTVALGWALVAQRTATRSLWGQQIVAVVATLAMLGLSVVGWDHDYIWLSAVVAAATPAFGLAMWWLRVRLVAVAAGALGLLSWLYLMTFGLVMAVAAAGPRELFLGLDGVPLLVGSALVSVIAFAPRVTRSVRTAAAVFAVAGPAVVALLPARELEATAGNLVVAATAVVLVVVGFAMPRPWCDGMRVVGAVTTVLPASTVLTGAGIALARVVESTDAAWTRAVTDPMLPLPVAAPVQIWAFVPLGALVVTALAAAALRRTRGVVGGRPPVRRSVH